MSAQPATYSEAYAENSASQRIVAAARRHFFAHGFRSVTMDDLAEELGMSKKTLYSCFSSKTALLKAVLLDKFRSVEADLDRIMSECSSDVLAALQRLLACMQHHTAEIQPPFVRDIRREAPEIFKIVESRRRDMIQRYFGKLFSEGRRAGIIRKDIPTKLIIEILLGATEAIMNPQKIAELDLTPKTGYSAIISVILEGVITKGARSKL
ncbi:MAG TPA: TetR/AcrR family transcriptional regulator [Candidatus Binatia bacterium]|jgi:AcrR family transcriptional regulator|nr:TetR/AcrR family transcriptional regulator [Candidatus Binatia bacterium]